MFTYFQVNFFAVLIPFLFSFHPKLQFYKTWKAFGIACMLTGIPFLIWDILFTEMGIWGFNPNYLTEIYFWNLPIEECLFFICIPYCCVYTYHCFKVLNVKDYLKGVDRVITIFLVASLVIIGLFSLKWYTTTTFISLATFLVLQSFYFKHFKISRFYFVYLILLIPFLVVNGVLTGTGLESPIVWYNNEENLNIRILTIPIEDVFYGMLLILANISIYERLLQKE